MEITESKMKEILGRGVSEVIGNLAEDLRAGKKLRVKFGIDPTSPDLHLGHAVILKKLRQFQLAGHKAVLIIGDFTARIGDPSGREGARQPLSPKEIERNMKRYLDLAGKIINIKDAHIYKNSTWLSDPALPFTLTAKVSVQQVMRRADFQKRLENDNDITVLEFLYPLLQGYDSVAVKADLEIGGNDQKFNLLMGRRIQRAYGLSEQSVLTMPLLEGTDGERKMSKSFGNYIALDEKPNKMFLKLMSVPDALIHKYFLLLTDLSGEEIKSVSKKPPFEQKKILGENIVSWLHSDAAAKKAREYFEKTFSKKETPENLESIEADTGESWVEFLARLKFVKSKGEAKRLIDGGGLDIDGKMVAKASDKVYAGVLKIGKHKFVKIITK